MQHESGFTLIEIILALIIFGILSAIAGMGIVSGIKGYMFTKENAQMTQKVNLAMTRLERELRELEDIDGAQASAEALVYRNASGWQALRRVGSTLKMSAGSQLPDDGRGDVLIDNVAALTLTYWKDDGSGTSIAWQAGSDPLVLLALIDIELILTRTDRPGETVTFLSTVNPRNNGNAGGVVPVNLPNFSPGLQ